MATISAPEKRVGLEHLNNEAPAVAPSVTTTPKVDKPIVKASSLKKTKPIKVQAKIAATPASKPAVATQPRITGNKTDWMAAAGIAESEWSSVDYIVSRESGWNPSAVNGSSGACGLVQALPCSKLGANWSNPVVALKWQKSYVESRYGGYAQAVAFWQANSWY